MQDDFSAQRSSCFETQMRLELNEVTEGELIAIEQDVLAAIRADQGPRAGSDLDVARGQGYGRGS